MAKTITGIAPLSSVSNAAGSSKRSTGVDVSALDGGVLRWTMTNGATPPTVQCVAKVLAARKQASMPAPAAAGAGDDDWKAVAEQGGGTVASQKTNGQYVFGPEEAYLHVEFDGNTGQAVTVECTGNTYVYP